MQARPHLSVVIPAYNEETRIAGSLDRLRSWLSGQPGSSEVLVVDDGSRDETARLVERFAAENAGSPVEMRMLSNRLNRGKGYSLKHGVLMAAGEYLLLSDADFSTPIEELPRLLELVSSEKYGIAIGSRGLEESKIEIHQPLWRESMGRCFNMLVRAITSLPYRDTQCGFKVMRREVVLPLFRAARVERFAYDVEILYLARRAGIRVAEVPVIWRDSPGSRVNAVLDSFDMLKDIIGIVLRARRGRYGEIADDRKSS